MRRLLSHSRYLPLAQVRWVLLWFVLAIAAAVVSPLVKPQSMQVICSSSGAIKLLMKQADGSTATMAHHTLDCPLCWDLNAPPLPVVAPQLKASAVFTALVATAPPPVVAWRSLAPLPARGPPDFS